MNKNPLESKTEKTCIEYACGKIVRRGGRKMRDPGKGCLHYKLNGMGKMGKPDQLFVLPTGHDWFVEFKRKGEEPTELQEIEAVGLIARGQYHSFIDDVDEFKFKLEWLLRLPARKRDPKW
jgi:hypothetical protein